MKIGELATATDTAVETIRFYERERLVPEPARTIRTIASTDRPMCSGWPSSAAAGRWT